MKNKSALYIVGAIVLLIVIGGGVMVMKNSNKPSPSPSPVDDTMQQAGLPQVDASVAVDVTGASGNKSVDISVKNVPADTTSIEYELTYNTGAGLPKGAIGKITTNGKTDLTQNVLLGTCSKGVCTYDTGVTSVNVVLKFNSPKGASQFTKDFTL